jgi:hypothetical protein
MESYGQRKNLDVLARVSDGGFLITVHEEGEGEQEPQCQSQDEEAKENPEKAIGRGWGGGGSHFMAEYFRGGDWVHCFEIRAGKFWAPP